MLLEDLARGTIAEAAARRIVEPVSEAAEVGVGERLGLDLARQVAAHPAVRVLDAALLPRAMRVAEIARQGEMAVEDGVARELAAAVEGDGPPRRLGQLPERAGDAGEDRGRAPVVVRQQEGKRLFLSTSEVTFALPCSLRKISRSASQCPNVSRPSTSAGLFSIQRSRGIGVLRGRRP